MPDINKIKINGSEIAYTRSGHGPAMILMHGWGCDHSTLASLAKVCEESHEVYNLDLPGFGQSTEPPTAWTVEEYTRMLEDFVKSLNLKRPSLLGHSFGGRIALLYASRNDVDKLVLVDAAGVKPRRSLPYYLKVYSFKAVKAIYPLLVGKKRAQQTIDQMRSRSGSPDYLKASPLMRQVLVKAVNTDLKSVMGSISAPTLLLWGEQDTATPLHDAKIMLRKIKNSKLVSSPGAGHFSFIDNPFQTAASLRRFLSCK